MHNLEAIEIAKGNNWFSTVKSLISLQGISNKARQKEKTMAKETEFKVLLKNT
jgi:hypothetical protein